MITIIFEAHGTTYDNEQHLSSGWNDVELSERGIEQSKELGERYKDDQFDAIFTSDLKRAYDTAEIAFEDRFKIITDERLRECNYGDFTQQPSEIVDVEKPRRIYDRFPNGESYEETTIRMKEFLEELRENYSGKKIMIIGHRATQYGLDYLIKGISLEELASTPFKWQPGWEYNF
ncbi:MAG: Phosphoglycerate mutase [Candidatus Nomurabacteria bacterium]|nr:Phosphoglycerate mutase [Candidatus Nomurabacteria bacterium]